MTDATVLKDKAHRIALGEDWRMEVTDNTGLVLFRLDFSVLEAPAVRRIWTKDQMGKPD